MGSSSDAAESIVRMSFQGLEVAAKITGTGAKNIAVLLYTILKNKKQTKGKATLKTMLKTKKELKIFAIKKSDLKKFMEEAKRYGVLFTALIDKKHKNQDGMVDIMVKAEDAGKINRIVERFNLSTIDTATIQSEITKSKDSKKEDVEVSIEDKLLEDILTAPKEESDIAPSLNRTEKGNQLENLSENKNYTKKSTNDKKPSVRKKLNDIKEQQKLNKTKEKSKTKSKTKTPKGRNR